MYYSLNHEAVRAAPSVDPEGGGGRGSGPPLENHKLNGFLLGISNWTPPGKKLDPLEKIGPHLEP